MCEINLILKIEQKNEYKSSHTLFPLFLPTIFASQGFLIRTASFWEGVRIKNPWLAKMPTHNFY